MNDKKRQIERIQISSKQLKTLESEDTLIEKGHDILDEDAIRKLVTSSTTSSPLIAQVPSAIQDVINSESIVLESKDTAVKSKPGAIDLPETKESLAEDLTSNTPLSPKAKTIIHPVSQNTPEKPKGFSSYSTGSASFTTTPTSTSFKSLLETPSKVLGTKIKTVNLKEDQEIVPSEEDKDILYQCKAKLYIFDDSWRERGTGVLKLQKLDGKYRVIMRTDVVLKLSINAWIHKDMPYKVRDLKYLEFIVADKDCSRKHLLKFKNASICEDLRHQLEDIVVQLKSCHSNNSDFKASVSLKTPVLDVETAKKAIVEKVTKLELVESAQCDNKA